ncbi:uncharacterized protein conserved in bacteria [Longilinea arvoryzae]|uniref:Uncharacterized protein conserved in bacteria n=1 Tax=Longilinea arvoryzae TaxID=360412 RepID=A0A0S7BEZ8_9CHLR|nr:protein tyrosine phosphatase family protein [Longilinea arvoryzae]GAP12363.1 uncharacterized protein conserved in bacteria [Longilinea arvoryzae]
MPDEPLNYMRISARLGCCGQPTLEQWDWIAAQGYQVVINLFPTSAPDGMPDAFGLASVRGLEYIHIPVVWETPTQANLQQFFAAMEAHRAQSVLVHCRRNYRASAFVYLWRVLRCGEPEEDARWDMLSVWEPDETWQALIDRALAAG